MTQLSKRQQEIVERSIELIADGGIQHLTMKNIADQLGVSEPAIYRHFKSKLDILLAIIDDFIHETQTVVDAVKATEGTASDKIWAMFAAHIEQFMTRPALAAVIFSEDNFRHESALAEKIFTLIGRNQVTLLQLFSEGQKSGDLRSDIPVLHLATIAMGSFRMLILRWKLTNYGFDLLSEAELHWSSIHTLIAEPTKNNGEPEC